MLKYVQVTNISLTWVLFTEFYQNIDESKRWKEFGKCFTIHNLANFTRQTEIAKNWSYEYKNLLKLSRATQVSLQKQGKEQLPQLQKDVTHTTTCARKYKNQYIEELPPVEA